MALVLNMVEGKLVIPDRARVTPVQEQAGFFRVSHEGESGVYAKDLIPTKFH